MEPGIQSALDAAAQSALEQLRDIHGIASVPWWPPAQGWWMLLGGLLVFALAAWRWRTTLRLRIPIPGITLGTWRWDAAAALRELRRRARAGQDLKDSAGELSELLRRIAMARLGRDACAGLTGGDWLEWLQQHDPAGFQWQERGRLLLSAPYAPHGKGGDRDLIVLIDAAYQWVSAPDPRTGRKRSGFLGLGAVTRTEPRKAANA